MSEPPVRPINAAIVSGTLGLPGADETGAATEGLPVSLGNTNVSVDKRGLAVSDGSVERVLLGLLPTGDYGLQVVNAGSTVIIDGTSEMFRIQASGTLSLVTTSPTWPATTTSVTLTGLGALATQPAHLSMIAPDGAIDDHCYIGTIFALGDSFVAVTSGGAVTTRRFTLTRWGTVSVRLNGATNECIVTLTTANVSGLTFSFPTKYYVFEQAAL